MSAKTKAKAKAKVGPMKIESSDGDWIQSNIWFKVGLTKHEAPMLKTIGRRIYEKPVSSALVLRKLVLLALAHYDKFEPLLFSDYRYAEVENFLNFDAYMHGLIAIQHAKITERKGKVKK